MLLNKFYTPKLISQIQRRAYTNAIKESETAIGKWIKSIIRSSGPITFYDFMKYSVQVGNDGYYQRNKNIFGKKGDFVTSPEISQTFGELIALNYVHEYIKINKNQKIVLVELGPGKGTLLKDMLRTFERFPKFFNNVTNIHLVENSNTLSNVQKNTLLDSEDQKQDLIDNDIPTKYNGIIPIKWHSGLDALLLDNEYKDSFVLLTAHEFFDALPIRKFKKVENEFREVMVNVNNDEKDTLHFNFVLNDNATASLGHLKEMNIADKVQDVEISPMTHNIMLQIKQLYKNNIGLAHIIDYGHNHFIQNGLRGIKNHQFIHPLSYPGETDLSSDVDFDNLSKLSIQYPNPFNTFTFKSQMQFLLEMGIQQRMQNLLSKKVESIKEQNILIKQKNQILLEYKTNLEIDYKRLVNEMGQIFKVLSLYKSK